MLYTPLTKTALRIAFDAHRNQRDKGGLPYILHPVHLAEQMEDEASICAALLHDTVEDGGISLDDLRNAGFPEEIVTAVRLLTHDPAVPYLDYVAELAKHPLARQVKLADLWHNSDLTRLDTVEEHDRQRVKKYAAALRLLEDISPATKTDFGNFPGSSL